MTIAGIEIELIRKRVKNVNLRIHTPDGRVTVSAPRRTSEAFIAEFVAAKAPWIRKQQARIAAMPPRPELTYTHGEEHAFLGHPYPLEIHAAAGRPGAEFQSRSRSGRITRRTARRCSRPRSARPRRSQAPHRPGVPPGIAGAPRRAGAGVGTTPRRENHQDSHPRHETQVGGMPHAHRRRRVQPRAHQAPATRHRIFGVARTGSLDRGIPQRTLSGHPHRAHAGLAGSRGHAQRTPLMAAALPGRESILHTANGQHISGLKMKAHADVGSSATFNGLQLSPIVFNPNWSHRVIVGIA